MHNDVTAESLFDAAIADESEISRQVSFIRNSGIFDFSNLVPYGLIVLNRHRQAVFINRAALTMAGNPPQELVLGKRPGSIYGCIHATRERKECGTTAFCSECGSANAIKSALKGIEAHGDCRMLCDKGQGTEALDLSVTAAPFHADNGDLFTVFSLQDVSGDKRKQALERVFFHDVLNLAGGLRGLLSHFVEQPGEISQDMMEVMSSACLQLQDEIMAQRDLAAAERGELLVRPRTVETLEQLEAVTHIYQKHGTAAGKHIEISEQAENVSISTDPVLLRRVLGNMTKNALEASSSGERITLDCQSTPEGITLSVHNPAVMPLKVKLQVFKRSFSTKGADRGLGTYSILLLSERYLNASVGFSSEIETGTSFWITFPTSE